MQTFTVVIKVTVNTIETVSGLEVRSDLESLLDEYEGGEVSVMSVQESSGRTYC